MEDDERRFRSVKRSSLGMPPCIPNKYSRRLKRLSLGMPPCIPFSINNHQFVFRSTIFLSLHALCAMLGASCSLFHFQFSLALFAVHSKLEPSFLCVGEKHAPLHRRTQHWLACLSFFLCVFFIFSQLLSCLALSFHAYLFKSFCLVCCWNSLEFSCLSC